ncbi:MAG: hypothetical protein ACKO5X_08480 [Limnohabitans sp.]
MRLRLAQIAHARSGDKANTADIGLFAWDPTGYAVLAEHVTAEKVAQHFSHLWPLASTAAAQNHVERFDLPQLLALKFVLRGALNGGAASSLRSDNLGKTIAAQLLRMEIELPQAQVDSVRQAAQTAIDKF